MSKKVLIIAPVHDLMSKWFEEAGYECFIHEKMSREDALKEIATAVGLITSTRLQIDKEMIDAATNLKWIGRMGSGMEIIDVSYAESKGVSCHSSPEGNCNAVGEHALGMLLALNKRIIKGAQEIEQGLWKRTENRGYELEGKTVGIVGFGHTGQAFARKLRGFDVNILAYDNQNIASIPGYVKVIGSLDELYEKADVVSFHVPLLKNTAHYFNHDFIEKMQKPFVLVNTSRGGVVDTSALLVGLKSGKVLGACVDVWEEEPISKMSEEMLKYLQEMSNMEQVVITPHIAGYSHEALYKMSKVLFDKIVRQA